MIKPNQQLEANNSLVEKNAFSDEVKELLMIEFLKQSAWSMRRKKYPVRRKRRSNSQRKDRRQLTISFHLVPLLQQMEVIQKTLLLMILIVLKIRLTICLWWCTVLMYIAYVGFLLLKVFVLLNCLQYNIRCMHVTENTKESKILMKHIHTYTLQ